MAVFLFLLLVAVVLGFLGILVKGLIWLLVIGSFVLVIDLLWAGMRMGRHTSRR